ncbi:hypothetical protein AALO_G00003610 [Alosa alosa]|uniref:Insulin-like domain-containing protein n=1 Tax=Alosa alosa TaxID=278164 RepID=A0AAV6HDL7_9TELE|nr:insulin-like 5b [Alosa alosa]KAG5285458.1 hypothetical protein AALO_G00003610 [Alosa alosa]
MGSFLLPVMVLSMLLLTTTVQAQSNGSTGLKLCGREFLRSVVYMCGGSRWRRELTGPSSEGYYSDPTGLESTESPLETQRQRRDMTQLLSVICCQVGCRKSDIIKLC